MSEQETPKLNPDELSEVLEQDILSMTEEKIAELRKLCDEATQEPWNAHDCYIPNNSEMTLDRYKCSRTLTSFNYHVIADVWGADRMQANIDFIAAARTAIPELLDEIERLKKENKRMDENLDRMAGQLVDGEYELNPDRKKAI